MAASRRKRLDHRIHTTQWLQFPPMTRMAARLTPTLLSSVAQLPLVARQSI
jgi:hypothetical protein